MSGKHAHPYSGPEQEIRALMHEEFSHFLADIEFRVKQAYDVQRRPSLHVVEGDGQVYAEDLNIPNRHFLTGYTVTANTPVAGSIAWASLHVVYNGTDNAVTDANTSSKYVWWDPAISTTVLQTGATKPDLSTKPNAALIFVNNSGVPYDVLASSIPGVIANGAVDAGAILPGAVTAPKMNTIQHLLY
jgi:hypothetical protein